MIEYDEDNTGALRLRILLPPLPASGARDGLVPVWELDDRDGRMPAAATAALSEAGAAATADSGGLYALIEAFRESLRSLDDAPALAEAADAPVADEADDAAIAYYYDASDYAEYAAHGGSTADGSGSRSSKGKDGKRGGGGGGKRSEPQPTEAKLAFSSGEPFEDRRSVFQAHVCTVHSVADVHAALEQLKSDKKIARATHNIMAYRIAAPPPAGRVLQDNDDDGETAAGSRLAHLLDVLGVENVLVVVSRWYGGIKLGADRFKHINNVARQQLDAAGYLKPPASEKEGKKKK